jgi:hypothetical protein
MPNPVALGKLSLRQRERGFVVGGVGTGKSTLMDVLGADFVSRYPKGRRLILDSKPRYKADRRADGMSAKRLYRNQTHGQAVRGSVLVETPDDLDLAWSTGARTTIAQCESSRDVPRLVEIAAAFLAQARSDRPQLLQVDETMDFYHSNGGPKGGDDAITRVARAGRERGCGALFGAQRTRGIPPTLLEEMNRLYCLRIDYVADAKRLPEMGAPAKIVGMIPQKPHQFLYWTKEEYSTLFGPYRLDLGAG